jgi:aldehyde:ferredoxin oxidoreductase
MGSKNLKAVVMSPGRAANWPTNDAARAAIKEYVSKIRSSRSYREFFEYGSTSGVSWTSHMGMLATRNYQTPQFAGVTDIDGRNLTSYVTGTRACHRCPVRCKAEIEVRTGRYAGLRGERPDFEPLVSLGSKVGLSDPEAVMYLHNLCDWLGLDSVSVGGSLAFAMELWQRGLLTAADTGGLELGWGDAEAMEVVIRQMAAGEGLGLLLGQGVRRAAAAIGRGAERYAMEVKGLELTAFDPRGVYATALGYAVSSRGGDYASVYARHEFEVGLERAHALYGDERAADRLSPVGKAAMVRRSMISSAVLDSIGICKVPALSLVNEYDLVNESRLVSGLTGIEMSPQDLFLAGERILVLERLFNLRFGGAAQEDTLPAVFLTEPMSDGPARGSRVDLAPMLQEFYGLMGWTERGIPTRERLTELGLQTYLSQLDDLPSQ